MRRGKSREQREEQREGQRAKGRAESGGKGREQRDEQRAEGRAESRGKSRGKAESIWKGRGQRAEWLLGLATSFLYVPDFPWWLRGRGSLCFPGMP